MPDQKRGETERKYRVAQACAEVLPEGRSSTGIVRREEHSEHEEETAEACRTHEDAENEREPDRQFAIGNHLNSGAKILTTSVLRLQELAINSLKDGLLFLTEGNDAGDLETALSVS